MASQRMINGKFWSDAYVRKLTISQRYLFLYLLTNEHTNISGVYEISTEVISFEAKIKEKDVLEIIKVLEDDGKIVYKSNWIFITNFIKNQNLNPSIIKGINKILNSIPSSIHSDLGTGWGQGGGRLEEYNLIKYNIIPNENETINKKNKKTFPFVEIDWDHEYTKAGHKHGKYRLFMGVDKNVYGKSKESSQYILLREIKKTY
jgi:hypothetical protein